MPHRHYFELWYSILFKCSACQGVFMCQRSTTDRQGVRHTHSQTWIKYQTHDKNKAKKCMLCSNSSQQFKLRNISIVRSMVCGSYVWFLSVLDLAANTNALPSQASYPLNYQWTNILIFMWSPSCLLIFFALRVF